GGGALRWTCGLSRGAWVLPWASFSAWTGFVSRLQPASGTIRAPTQKAAMIGRALVFMIRLLSGKKRGEAGWSLDSRSPPLQGGAAKGCFAPVLRFSTPGAFPGAAGSPSDRPAPRVYCRFCATIPNPHPRPLSHPLPPSLTGRGEEDLFPSCFGFSPSSPGEGGWEGTGEEGRGDEGPTLRPAPMPFLQVLQDRQRRPGRDPGHPSGAAVD